MLKHRGWKPTSIKTRPNEGITLPSKCNKPWMNFEKIMSNERVYWYWYEEGKVQSHLIWKFLKFWNCTVLKWKYYILTIPYEIPRAKK